MYYNSQKPRYIFGLTSSNKQTLTQLLRGFLKNTYLNLFVKFIANYAYMVSLLSSFKLNRETSVLGYSNSLEELLPVESCF